MKKFFLYTGITVAILFLLYFGISFWLVRSTHARVQAARQAIADAGDKVYLTEYETDEIPDEENAYFYVMLAAPDLEAFEADWNALDEIEFERGLTPEQVDALAAVVQKYGAMFERLEQAAQCEQYRPKVDYSDGVGMLIPHVMHFRNASRALSARSLVAAYQDNGDAALADCKTSLRLSDHLRHEPTVISHLVRVACQAVTVHTANHTLRVAETSPDARAELESLLAQIDNHRSTVDAMKGERAMGVLTFQQMRDGTLATEDVGAPPIGVFGGTWLGQAYLNDDEAMYIELLDKQIEAVELSQREREQAMQPLLDELEQSGFRHVFSRLLVPALNSAVEATDRQDALVKCLRVLLVIVHEQDAEIDDVDLPEAAKTDPFNGQPLLLRRSAGEWIVYSVGENLLDDGGNCYPSGTALDQGVGPLLPPSAELPEVVEP